MNTIYPAIAQMQVLSSIKHLISHHRVNNLSPPTIGILKAHYYTYGQAVHNFFLLRLFSGYQAKDEIWIDNEGYIAIRKPNSITLHRVIYLPLPD